MRTQVGGPQPALLDDLLQGRNQRLAHRVVEIVRFLDDQIDWLTLSAHELVNPGELVGPLWVGREIPGHYSSFRCSVVVSPLTLTSCACGPPPPRWRG